MAAQTEKGIPLSSLCPKFLHTNSTSHTWPFSAIAELIDNAYDPDVNAQQLWIDKTLIRDKECLIFMDNGNGMNWDKMHKMLSFGFSDKQTINGHVPVGLYGNGFKSGSMRLGRDAIVFTKNGTTMCVGLLSQTYLENIKAEHIVVPIITYCQKSRRINDQGKASLNAILKHSLFRTDFELTEELMAIMGPCGTRVIIWNLRKMSNGKTEFDFDTDKYDIRIPADILENTSEKYKKQERMEQSVPESDYSLRAYCSILYLKPRMQIILRGQKVKTQLISKSLAYIERDIYRPSFLNNRNIRITFGYNTKSKEQYGIMMYHRNRLIKAYERVGCQLKANNMGVGVIGVIECNFLKPTHNKQDFDYTDEYRKTIQNLGSKLMDYWKEIRFKRNANDPNTVPVEDTQKRPDQNWVQCDDCLKWRKLPDGIDKLPDKWYCRMNPDPQFRSCEVPEEPEDDDNDHPTYEKTYKQHERIAKMKEERTRRQMEDARKKAEMDRYVNEQNHILQLKHNELKRQLRENNIQVTMSAIPNPDVPSGSGNNMNNMPKITDVRSLSAAGPRIKRTMPVASGSSESKKAKINGIHNSVAAAGTSENDTDIMIVEAKSTPKPAASFDLARVKVECRDSMENTGLRMECSEDAGLETPNETITAPPPSSPSTSATPPLELQVSTTTQTEVKAPLKREESLPEEPVETNGLPMQQEETAVAMEELKQVLEEAKSQKKDLQKALEEAQRQQDELMTLMQTTAQERDSYQEEVHRLTCLVVDLEKEVQQLTGKYVKKEVCHKATETDQQDARECLTSEPFLDKYSAEPSETQKLYEQSQKEVEKLRKRCEALEAEQAKCSTNQSDVDDLALQLDSLLRNLDKSNEERDKCKIKLETLEAEKVQMASECEKLKRAIDKLTSETERRTENGTCSSTVAEEEAKTSQEDTWRLRNLRLSIGKLLVTFVPALDLEQVNYESDVIDEILEQVLDQVTLTSNT
ncbi:MORC family CW-type zinc finger protein 3 [Amia ocellicauda]|uniref:MORC family CW-type zinc finger protein 3 n=1 Tax=Amia ocellicauda TaxID=2972642 RepID=UPI0034647B6B